MTQTERVLALLRERGERGLTPLEALDYVGSFRLGARIWELRQALGQDEEIVTERARTVTGKSIARYVLRAKRATPNQATLWEGL